MKCTKLFSGFLAAVMLLAQAAPVNAAENVIHLYEGEVSADAWTCPLTLPVVDRSIYAEGNTIAVQCDTDAAPYFVLTSNSGGEEWAQVQPDGAEGDMYYYSYDAMAASFGTDFSQLDYISVMAANAPVTVYSIDMIIGSASDAPEQDEVQHESRVVGYLPDWSYQAYGNLDFSALTHLNISFCNPDAEGNLSCYIPNSEMKNIVNKAHSSDVKVMAALGGGGGCDGYLPLIDTPGEMADFNENIMAYCETYNLDGIDLDIELGSSHEIWNYYADWVESLRALCDERGYELSTATAQWVAVNVTAETFGLFDFVNVMAYDNDADESSHADMEFAQNSLQYFNVQKKIPKDRLVLGVPFYGRGYTADGALDWNSYVSFSELIASDTANYDKDLYNGIAYNGASTMREKCAMAKKFGGIMIWELSLDAAGEYSLLSVIKDELTVSAVHRGDVNADGDFTVADLVMLQKWLVRSGDITDWRAGDLCEDGILDIFDLVVMRQELVSELSENFVDVSTVDELFLAMRNAQPGDVIRVASGTYDYTTYQGAQKIDTSAEGTKEAPIILTAADPKNPPIITGTNTEHGYVFHITGDYWILENLKITTSQKGIVLDNSNHTIIRNCEVYNIGSEAIAIRDGSSYCTVKDSYIHDTGTVTPAYGEGVYIGSAKSVTGFDYKCDYNTVDGCTFKNVAAEHVDVKEYTTGTEIMNCTFYGDGMTGANYAGSFVDIAGNDVNVHDNVGHRNGNINIVAAFELHEQVDGWGYHCTFTDNILHMDQPYGAVDTSRRMYVVDGWYSDFSVKNNKVDYGNGLVSADSWEYYNSDYVTYLE